MFAALGARLRFGAPCRQQALDPQESEHAAGEIAGQGHVVDLVRAEVHCAHARVAQHREDRADEQQDGRREPDQKPREIAHERAGQGRQGRGDNQHDHRRRRQIDEHETAEKRADDRADRPEEVHVADRTAGLPRLLDRHLGDDRPHHPQHRRRNQENQGDDQYGADLPGDAQTARQKNPTNAFIHSVKSVKNAPRANSGPTARRGSTRSASRPPSTLPRQMPPRMIPITLVHTASDAPTCRATSRLETSSRVMMHMLLKNARA